MDANERESINNKIVECEAIIDACTVNIEEGEIRAKTFKQKRMRYRQELAGLNRRLQEK